MKHFKILVILVLFAGCNSEKEWNKEELEIVGIYINEKLFIDLIYPTINDRYDKIIKKDSTKHYSLDEKSALLENLKKEIPKEKNYYITISDSLFPFERQTIYFMNEMATHDFEEEYRGNNDFKKIDTRKLKIRAGLNLVYPKNEVDSIQYLGEFAISKVIFDKYHTRALITHKFKNGYQPEMTEFIKKDNQWKIKKRWK